METADRQGQASLAEAKEKAFARAAIALLRGVISRGRDEALWQDVLEQQISLRDYFQRIGLRLYLDAADEYAYLRQMDDAGLPRLIPRTQLSYGFSLILVELRKTLGELGTASEGTLVVSLPDMVRRLKPFFPPEANELKFQQRVERYLNQADHMGFVQPVPGREAEYTLCPLIRSFVDAQWLSDFADRMEEYAAYGREQAAGTEDDGLFEQDGEEGEDGLI